MDLVDNGAYQQSEECLYRDEYEGFGPEECSDTVHVLIDFSFHQGTFILPNSDDCEWRCERCCYEDEERGCSTIEGAIFCVIGNVPVHSTCNAQLHSIDNR